MRELKDIIMDEFNERHPSEKIKNIAKQIIKNDELLRETLNNSQIELYHQIDNLQGDMQVEIEFELIEFVIDFYHKILS